MKSQSPAMQEAQIIDNYDCSFGQRTPTIGRIKKLAKEKRAEKYRNNGDTEIQKAIASALVRSDSLLWNGVMYDDKRIVYCKKCTMPVGMWNQLVDGYYCKFNHACFPHPKYPGEITGYTDIPTPTAITMSDWELPEKPGTLWNEVQG